MTVNLSMLAGAGAQFFTDSGVPLTGGLIYTYAAGTTTPQATYTSSSGSTAHSNPIVLNSAGRIASGGEIWLTDAVSYKFVLQTSAAVTIATYDNVTGNASGIYAAFAASSGSSLVGYIQTGTGATATTVQAKLRQIISVMDFGAKGDGTTDDTTAIQNALNLVAIGTAPGATIYFPRGTYLTSGLTITSTAGNNNADGQNGIKLTGDFAILKGTAGCTKILSVTSPNSSTYTNGIRVEGLQFDMSLMANAATTYGIYIKNSYDAIYQNIVVTGTPSSAFSIYIDQRAYTISFINCDVQYVKLSGANVQSDAITTISFYSLNAKKVTLSQSSQISFYSCVVQGNNNLFDIYSCSNITIIGGDFEGTSGYYLNLSYAGSGTDYGINGITSLNNNITSAVTYVTGNSAGSNYQDKNRFSRGTINSTKNSTITTTAATTIYTYDGDYTYGSGLTGTAALLFVIGDDGSNGFADLIGVAFGNVYTINSKTVYGTPPTRTYTVSTINIKLALSAVTANNVRTLSMSSAYQ